MKAKSWLWYVGILIITVTIIFTSCDLFLSGEATVDFQARILTPDTKSLPHSKGETDVNLTPTEYKMAVTYFALIKDDGTEVKVTERLDSDPLIVDFSKEKPGTLIESGEGTQPAAWTRPWNRSPLR
jgi:hypothetical protein